MKLEYRHLSENTQISNFMKIRPVAAKLLRTDGQQNMTKLTVAFRNFAHAPKNKTVHKKICTTFTAYRHDAMRTSTPELP